MFDNVEFQVGREYYDCKDGIVYVLKIEVDELADLSYLGEFNSEYDENAIDTHNGCLYRWDETISRQLTEEELNRLEDDEDNIVVTDWNYNDATNTYENVHFNQRVALMETKRLDRGSFRYFHPEYTYRMENPYKDPQNIKIAVHDYERVLSHGYDWVMTIVSLKTYKNGKETNSVSTWIASDSGEDGYKEVLRELLSELEVNTEQNGIG